MEDILNEIRANRQELCIDDIKKEFFRWKGEYTTVPEIVLPVTTTTYYKPISLGVKIITIYGENIFYKNRVEDTVYIYTVGAGVSVDDLAHMYYTFRPCMADCKSALELLLRRDLIRPIKS